jgi:hypothetical protein
MAIVRMKLGGAHARRTLAERFSFFPFKMEMNNIDATFKTIVKE